MQESQRYVGYNRDKFGSEVTYIIPYWCNLPEGNVTIDNGCFVVDGYFISEEPEVSFLASAKFAESSYMTLTKDLELKPQEAREILLNATKTEVVMTGFISDWEEFFKLRCDKAAHPDMRKLANNLKQQFVENGYL